MASKACSTFQAMLASARRSTRRPSSRRAILAAGKVPSRSTFSLTCGNRKARILSSDIAWATLDRRTPTAIALSQ